MAGHVRPGVCVCACRRCLRTVHVEHEDLDRPSSVAQSHLALRVARGQQLSRRDLRQRCQLLQQRQVHRRCRPWSRGRRLCFLWSAGDQASLEQSLHCASRQCEQSNSGNWRLRTSSRQPAKAQAQLRGLHLFEKCSARVHESAWKNLPRKELLPLHDLSRQRGTLRNIAAGLTLGVGLSGDWAAWAVFAEMALAILLSCAVLAPRLASLFSCATSSPSASPCPAQEGQT